MPQKLRTNKKAVARNKHAADDHSVIDVNTASGLPQEAEDQFELELCWCINQLCTFDPKAHSMGGHTEKQARDLEKSLSILRGNTAPLVKKRQVMRQIFGNYREKMAQDEQKHGKAASSVKFVAQSSLNKKSVFIKKANHVHESIVESQRAQPKLAPSIDINKLTNKLENKEEISLVPFKFNFGN